MTEERSDHDSIQIENSDNEADVHSDAASSQDAFNLTLDGTHQDLALSHKSSQESGLVKQRRPSQLMKVSSIYASLKSVQNNLANLSRLSTVQEDVECNWYQRNREIRKSLKPIVDYSYLDQAATYQDKPYKVVDVSLITVKTFL